MNRLLNLNINILTTLANKKKREPNISVQVFGLNANYSPGSL